MPSRSPFASRPYLRALRVRGIAGQPGTLGGRGVEVHLVPGVVDDHQRGIRGGGVQPVQRRLRQAGLQQRVPADQVRAVGATGGDLAPDRVHDGVGVAHRDGPDVDHAVGQHDRLHQRMSVRLDESRHHAAIADVQHLRVGSDQRLDVGPGADGDEPAVGHGQRLGRGCFGVDGQDCSVDDKVCGGHEDIFRDFSRAVSICAGSVRTGIFEISPGVLEVRRVTVDEDPEGDPVEGRGRGGAQEVTGSGRRGSSFCNTF